MQSGIDTGRTSNRKNYQHVYQQTCLHIWVLQPTSANYSWPFHSNTFPDNKLRFFEVKKKGLPYSFTGPTRISCSLKTHKNS